MALTPKELHQITAGGAITGADLLIGVRDNGDGTFTDYKFTPPSSGFRNSGGSNTQVLVGAGTMVIPHGFGSAPSRVIPISRKNSLPMWNLATIDATNFTIAFASPVTATVTFDFQNIP